MYYSRYVCTGTSVHLINYLHSCVLVLSCTTHTQHTATVVPVLSVTCIQFRLKTLLPTIFTTCTRSSKRHRLTSYLFLRRSFDWKRLRKRSAAVYNLSLSTQQSKLTKYQKRVLLNANRTINWTKTHLFSIQSFIEIPSYHPWEPGSSHMYRCYLPHHAFLYTVVVLA